MVIVWTRSCKCLGCKFRIFRLSTETAQQWASIHKSWVSRMLLPADDWQHSVDAPGNIALMLPSGSCRDWNTVCCEIQRCIVLFKQLINQPVMLSLYLTCLDASSQWSSM